MISTALVIIGFIILLALSVTMICLYIYNRQLHPGDMKFSAQMVDYKKWLLCDGRSVSRNKYRALFNVIGTTYGGSDEDNTFKLPDCRGRVLGAIGKGTGLTDRIMGNSVGEEKHTMTVPELATHTHTGTTNADGIHTHTSNAVGGTIGLITADQLNTASGNLDKTESEPNLYTAPQALTINNSGSHTHGFTTGQTGASTPFNVMQPTLFAGNVFIYYGQE